MAEELKCELATTNLNTNQGLVGNVSNTGKN